jgi:hypothetical protein
VHTNAVARREVRDIRANSFHRTRDFVPKRQWQILDLGNAGAIVLVRVADSGRLDPN